MKALKITRLYVGAQRVRSCVNAGCATDKYRRGILHASVGETLRQTVPRAIMNGLPGLCQLANQVIRGSAPARRREFKAGNSSGVVEILEVKHETHRWHFMLLSDLFNDL